MRSNASRASGEAWASYKSNHLRRTCAQQAISRTRATTPGLLGTKSGSKPAYASTCSFPSKPARCFCGYLPCQLGEYRYHTAGGSVDPQPRPSRTYVHSRPFLVFPLPGANTLIGVSSALILGAESTCLAKAAT